MEFVKNFLGFLLCILKSLKKLDTYAFFLIFGHFYVLTFVHFSMRIKVLCTDAKCNETFNPFLIRWHMFSQKLSFVLKFYIFCGWIAEIEKFPVVSLSVLPLRFLAVSMSRRIFLMPRLDMVAQSSWST